MGVTSKAQARSVKARSASTTTKKGETFKCVMCGFEYRSQKNNFPPSQSPMFAANNNYMPICRQCVLSMYEKYHTVLGDPREAVKRMCMKLDIYWNPEVYAIVDKGGSVSSNRMSTYISRSYLFKYSGKTYDDTLEEAGRIQYDAETGMVGEFVPNKDDDVDLTVPVMSSAPVTAPTTETVLFWGVGFTPAFYTELNLRYDRWTKDLPKPLTMAEEALYKQICIQETQINKNMVLGKPIEQGQNALNSLLGSLNAKPIQKKEESSASSEVDSTPLGVWIRKWEEKRPVPDYPEDDLGGGRKLIHYITVWLYGHLGKALGIRNTYSKAYEDEIDKYRVQKPEFIDEDDEMIVNDIIADGGDV